MDSAKGRSRPRWSTAMRQGKYEDGHAATEASDAFREVRRERIDNIEGSRQG